MYIHHLLIFGVFRCSKAKPNPNPDLMAQCVLLLMLKQPFQVKPTAKDKSGLPSAINLLLMLKRASQSTNMS